MRPSLENLFCRAEKLGWLRTEGRAGGASLYTRLVVVTRAQVAFDGDFLAHFTEGFERCPFAQWAATLPAIGNTFLPRSLPMPPVKNWLKRCHAGCFSASSSKEIMEMLS